MTTEESLHEAARLRFRFQMNNRLRLECLAAVSKVFREFEAPLTDELLGSIVFALPQELVSNGGNGYASVEQAASNPPEKPSGNPPDGSPKPGNPPDGPPKPGNLPDGPPRPGNPPDGPPKPGNPPDGPPKPGNPPDGPPRPGNPPDGPPKPRPGNPPDGPPKSY